MYKSEFAFVWRSAIRLGVKTSAIDDVVQEVFFIVHRRLAEFEFRSSIRTWVFAILRRVVADHRRTLRRKPAEPTEASELQAIRDPGAGASMARFEASDLVNTLLEALDDEKREVFVLAELEELTLAEIAQITGTNANTVASRLRVARRIFEEAHRNYERTQGTEDGGST
ncbi:RNA polymerase sigma factor RpoE [Labilithrix luteola]|uniref:RNA polymerase sigma factor RpoE n=1 Tax=Labilithrix luteola TaxID=1391654 RepID=A0A0K1QAL5_9BACT|nr:RNA polymerase sigma factor [Labilithrix luteola]AKV02779.1 RNA polymerase sigma factor RpoE [Labilithrix luteola]